MKAVRELGLDRRETGRPLPDGSGGTLWGSAAQYERTGVDEPMVSQLFCQGHCWVAMFGKDKR